MTPAEVKSRDPRDAVRRLMPLIGTTIDLENANVEVVEDLWVVFCAVMRGGPPPRVARGSCSHCGWVGGFLPMEESREDVEKHTKTCPKHPMRALEQQVKSLERDKYLLQLTVDSIRGCKDQYKYQLLQREEQLRGLLGADTSPSESPASDARLPQTTGDPAGDAAPAQGNGG